MQWGIKSIGVVGIVALFSILFGAGESMAATVGYDVPGTTNYPHGGLKMVRDQVFAEIEGELGWCFVDEDDGFLYAMSLPALGHDISFLYSFEIESDGILTLSEKVDLGAMVSSSSRVRSAVYDEEANELVLLINQLSEGMAARFSVRNNDPGSSTALLSTATVPSAFGDAVSIEGVSRVAYIARNDGDLVLETADLSGSTVSVLSQQVLRQGNVESWFYDKSDLVFAEDRDEIYVMHEPEGSPSRLAVYTLNRSSGALALKSSTIIPSPIGAESDICYDQARGYVYAAYQYGGADNLGVFDPTPTGEPTLLSQLTISHWYNSNLVPVDSGLLLFKDGSQALLYDVVGNPPTSEWVGGAPLYTQITFWGKPLVLNGQFLVPHQSQLDDGGNITEVRGFQTYEVGHEAEGYANTIAATGVMTPGQSEVRLNSVSVYTHVGGQQFKLGIYFGSEPIYEPRTLVWESETLTSVEGDWITVPVDQGSPSAVTLVGNAPHYIAWHTASEMPIVGFVAQDHASTTSFLFPWTESFLPVELDPRTDTLQPSMLPGRNYRFSVYMDVTEVPALYQLFVHPYYNDWVSGRGVEVSAWADDSAEYIDFDEDPVFSQPQTFEYVDSSPHTYVPRPGATADRVLYARAYNDAGYSDTKSIEMKVDAVAPPTPEVQLLEEYSHGNRLTFWWESTPDPQPGSGTSYYDVRFGRSADSDDLGVRIVRDEGTETHYAAVQAMYGEDIFCRVRANDYTDNASAWSNPHPTYVQAPPEVRNLRIDPPNPTTIDDLTATYDLFDLEGDEITNVDMRWMLEYEIQITGTTSLSHTATTRGQTWRFAANAVDVHGIYGPPAYAFVNIENSLPTQPFVEIRPRTPDPDEDLVVNVLVYSTDADGDSVEYDFEWYESQDGGATWIHKVELNGSPQVSQNYIDPDELWQVHYIPYETTGRRSAQRQIAGRYGWDQVYVGENNPPTIILKQPVARTQPGGLDTWIGWKYGEPDSEPCTVDLYWTDLGSAGLQQLQFGVSADLESFSALADLPKDRPVYIHAIIRDPNGAIDQKTSQPVLVDFTLTGFHAY